MSSQIKHLYEFGEFRLDPAEQLLLRDGQPVPLRPKVFDILLLLVENKGHLVEKEELMKAVWLDSFVEEGNLNKNISMLRHALGENSGARRYIETVPKRGYRFVADVREVQNGSTDVLIVEQHTRTRIVAEEEETNWHGNADGSIADRRLGPADSALAPTAMETEPIVDHAGKAEWLSRKSAIVLAVSVIAVMALVFGLSRFGGHGHSENTLTAPSRAENRVAAPFQMMKIEGLTHTGDIGHVAISPDGKYVAYSVIDAGHQSLWLRQVAADSNQQIVPPAEVYYYPMIFSHDGNYLYLIRSQKDSPQAALYRMPVLGGVATRLIKDSYGPVALSADDKQLAFTRYSRDKRESMLMIADADGTGERVVAMRPLADPYKCPAWSPDGRVIACATGTGELSGAHNGIVAVRVEDGAESPITSQKWRYIGRLAWLRDGSGLVMVAGRDQKPEQIWHLSYTSGEARTITNDLNGYRDLSLTADSNVLVTAVTGQIANIWVVPDGDPRRARRITTGYDRVRWTPDGRIVYASSAMGNASIWVTRPDGMDQEQLTAGWHHSVSSDGRHVVFNSDRTGSLNVWRMDLDSGNPVQLTDGDGEKFPEVSPDGRWVVYARVSDWTLWKVPIDGGEPTQLAGSFTRDPVVSPDGKWLACSYRDEQPDSPWRIAVYPFEGGQPAKTFDLPKTAPLPQAFRWTPDGQALAYIDTRDGVSNIWGQPLNGGPPAQLTDFKSDQISHFDWSRDGKQLALVRGVWRGDIVLIRNFR